MTFKVESDTMLATIAIRNKLDIDSVAAAYLIAGDDVLPIMHALEGKTLHIPSSRRLSCGAKNTIHFIEDDEHRFSDARNKDIIEYKDKKYRVVTTERKFLNHTYLPVTEVHDE